MIASSDAPSKPEVGSSSSRGWWSLIGWSLFGLLLQVTGSAAAVTINHYQVPHPYPGPAGIAAGPDGNVWFTEAFASKVAKVSPSGVITEFALPTSDSTPYDIVTGPDGNLWCTERLGNKIARITPAGIVTEYPIPTSGSQPKGIVAGSDGHLWFLESGARNAASITPSGVITEFPVPWAETLYQIAAGADGNLWFSTQDEASPGAGSIGRLTPTGAFTRFPLSLFAPGYITAGPDGALWFTGFAALGRMSITGAVTSLPIVPPLADGSFPSDVTAGPDGHLWFNGFTPRPGGISTWVARMTLDGRISQFPTFVASRITTGPDGNVWFTTGDGVCQIVMATVPSDEGEGVATLSPLGMALFVLVVGLFGWTFLSPTLG